MGNGQVVSGLDRLPWLSDEGEAPRRRRRHRPAGTFVWAGPLLLVVAAASYWLGVNKEHLLPPFATRSAPQTDVNMAVPEPLVAEPATPLIDPLPEPAMPAIAAAPPVSARVLARPKPEPSASAKPASKPAPEAKAKPEAKSGIPDPWPVREIEGSAGRLVRIGAFSSRAQAKRAWRILMRVNPWLQRLPALVVANPSARNGKTYYRLQMGTTSQAHSVALCQKMRMIGQSCIVVPTEPAGNAA